MLCSQLFLSLSYVLILISQGLAGSPSKVARLSIKLGFAKASGEQNEINLPCQLSDGFYSVLMAPWDCSLRSLSRSLLLFFLNKSNMYPCIRQLWFEVHALWNEVTTSQPTSSHTICEGLQQILEINKEKRRLEKRRNVTTGGSDHAARWESKDLFPKCLLSPNISSLRLVKSMS